jgi:tight adherence protein B
VNGHQIATVLLAAALLTAPGPPVRRIPLAPRRSARRSALPAAAAACLAAVLMPPSVVLMGAIVALVIATRVRRRRRDRRRRREGRLLAGALELLVGELRIGSHPLLAFTIAATESPDPVGPSLRVVATRAGLGADVGEGIRAVAITSEVASHWNRLAVFWDLAAQHGLAISVLMRAAHRDIVDRQRFADRMSAALAGARATAAILAALPVLGVLLGEVVGAHPLRFLFGGGPGGVLLVVGVSLMCAGVLWADRIIDRMAT